MRKLKKVGSWQSRHLGKRVIIVAVSGILLAQPITAILPGNWQQAVIVQANAATATAPVLKLKQQSIITAGAKRLDYVWQTTSGSTKVETDVHVIEIDLTNPYVSLNAMSGKNNSIAQRNNILNMTKENGAVAGINADIFVMANDGAPLGAQVTSGVLMSSPSKLKGLQAFAITKDRKPVIDAYDFSGTVTAENGNTFPIEGMNMSAYYPEVEGVTYSHVNTMYIYTSAWGGAERPNNSATKPTEVLVRDGIIEEISIDQPLVGQAPENGYILRTHGTAATFVKQNLAVGQMIQADYALVSQSTKELIDPASFEMLIGGHTLLVDGGAASAFSRDIAGVSGSSYTSRTAVGYSKDGTKVYLITSEKNGGNRGLTLKELQQVMVQLGVYKGINLDGGGSTTMIERPLGNTTLQLSHPTQESSQRSVANGIGVFTSAPQGKLKGMLVSGSNVMFLGQTAKYSVRGYDTYYNPLTVDPAAQVWSAADAIGTWQANEFTATKIGKTKITVKSDTAQAQYDVEVVGQDQIASMKINATSGMLTKGATISVPTSVKLNNGKTYNLSDNSIKWEFVGFKGTYKDGKITVDEVEKNAKTGYAIARYDGFGAMIPFTDGEKVESFEDFEVSRYAITSQVTPKETTTGTVRFVTDLPEQKSGRALQIEYDFTNGTGTRAVYAAFGSNGVTMPGSPTAMQLDVFSDNSNNWLRAEFVDADGKVHLVDIAKQLNWSGWKKVRVNLAAAGMKYPAKLKRIYVVTIAEGDQSKLAPSGAIAIDNIDLLTSKPAVEPEKSKITMTIGNSTAYVNGKAIKLEAAPLLLNGTTYVPVRFVTEAMGSEIVYDHPTRRVTVLRGKQMFEMNIGKKDFTLDGVRHQSDVAPFTRNGRTLIPIRLFSEQLGFNVEYDAKTKKITID